jgi:hypothetical protein
VRARAGIAGAVAGLACVALATPAAGAPPATSAWRRGVTVVTDSPLPPRDAPAVVAMDDRLLVFGGGKLGEGVSVADGHRDGAILDLRTRRWHGVAPAPFPLVAPAGIWTGKQVVVVGTEVSCSNASGGNECRTGPLRAATYTPSADRWRTVELPHDFAEAKSWTPQAVRWTGSEAIFSLGSGLVAVDPGDGSGRAVPQETPPSTAGQCGSSRFFTLIGIRHADPRTLQLGPAVLGGGSSAFRDGPPFAVAAPVSPLATVCTTKSVFVVSTDLTTIARYDVPTRRWSSVTPPAGATPCSNGCLQYRVTGHGDVVDAWLPGSARALRYDTRTGRWTDVASGPGTETSIDLTWIGGLGATTRFDASTGADTGELVIWRPV